MKLSSTPDRPPVWRRILLPGSLALLVFVLSAIGGPNVFRASAREDAPLTRAAPADNRIALTFDVTWGQVELRKLIVILEANQVHATFFVGGTFLSSGADDVRQLAARGHEVGTLGQKVVDLSVLPEQEVTSNLLASQSLLSKHLGAPVRYFRPPLGPASKPVVRGALAADLITVTYSVDGQEQTGRPTADIVKRVVSQARKGDIIRLTASDWSPETAKALPAIIKGLRAKGFKLVTLSELVAQ